MRRHESAADCAGHREAHGRGDNIYLNTIYIYMMFIHSNSSKDHFMDFELGGHYYVTFDDR